MTESSQQTKPPVPSNSSILARLLELFTMRRRLARALPEGFDQGSPGWEAFAFARSAIIDAHHLSSSEDGLRGALLLYRAAILLLVRCLHTRNGGASAAPGSGAESWRWFSATPEGKARLAELQGEVASLIGDVMTDSTGEAFLAGLPHPMNRELLPTMAALAKSLADGLRAKAAVTERIRTIRAWRVGLAVAACAVGAGYLTLSQLSRANLALSRPVIVSSSSAQEGIDPNRVVDGDVNSLGFHTDFGSNQFVQIDLGQAHRIRRVDVYNRLDCCQERAVPLRLEVSLDGRSFTRLLVHGTQFEHWIAQFPPVNARYVRLTRTGDSILHLNEVEVR